MNNLSYNTDHNKDLAKVKKLLTWHINKIGRPFGEHNTSDNAALPCQVENEVNIVKQIKVIGEKVILKFGLQHRRLLIKHTFSKIIYRFDIH